MLQTEEPIYHTNESIHRNKKGMHRNKKGTHRNKKNMHRNKKGTYKFRNKEHFTDKDDSEINLSMIFKIILVIAIIFILYKLWNNSKIME